MGRKNLRGWANKSVQKSGRKLYGGVDRWGKRKRCCLCLDGSQTELWVGNLRSWADEKGVKIRKAIFCGCVGRRGKRERCWLVLDGPADASWVEDLNTALDDSRKLCLPSGETLPLPTQMAVIFEVLDLSQVCMYRKCIVFCVYIEEGKTSWICFLC